MHVSIAVLFSAFWWYRYLLDETSCLWVEKCVDWRRAQRPAWSCESLDVVVGRETFALLVSIDTICGAVWLCHCVDFSDGGVDLENWLEVSSVLSDFLCYARFSQHHNRNITLQM